MNGPRLISDSIPKVAGKVFSRKYIMLGRLVTNWADIIGPDLASKTQPVKIRYIKARAGGSSEKKLTASLDIATATADATVLHYRKDLIIERINQIFGERWITAIRFVPVAANTPSAIRRRPKPLTADQAGYLSRLLENVRDEDIQLRLKNLGSAILQDPSS
jgi:hypothetical protein